MRTFTDQLGREVKIEFPPQRIVSVVPSQTELLADLHLDEEIVGITKFCVHPESWFRSKERVGGTKKLHLEKIRQLQPDLIIANKEENTEAEIRALEQEFSVWVSDISTLEDALAMILSVGELTGHSEQAKEMAEIIRSQFQELEVQFKNLPTKRAAYFIWKRPYMTAGGDTFIDKMMEYCRLENVFHHLNRYPEISPEQLKGANPELILLSSEPYPFKERHLAEFKEMCPQAHVLLVDGEMFSWYGSRLLKAVGYFKGLIENLRG